MILELDFETTGLDEQQHGIVEIGARWFRDYAGLTTSGGVNAEHVRQGEFFRQCRPHPLALFDPEALKVNGQREEELKARGGMPEAQAMVELLGFIRGGIPCDSKVVIAAWNAHFEMRFLRRALLRAGIEERHWGIRHSVLDPLPILMAEMIRGTIAGPHKAYSEWGGLVRNSDHASEILGIEPEAKPHNALNGARQVHKMLLALGFPHGEGRGNTSG